MIDWTEHERLLRQGDFFADEAAQALVLLVMVVAMDVGLVAVLLTTAA